MNITRSELTELLSKAFDEGMSGYLEFKESFINEAIEEFEKPQVPSGYVTAAPSLSSWGYGSITVGPVSTTNNRSTYVPNNANINVTTIENSVVRGSVFSSPTIDGHLSSINVPSNLMPTSPSQFTSLEITSDIENNHLTANGSWIIENYRPATGIVVDRVVDSVRSSGGHTVEVLNSGAESAVSGGHTVEVLGSGGYSEMPLYSYTSG